MNVAHDVDVGVGDRLALADDRAARAPCSASPAAMLATGRSSTIERVAGERDVAVDLHRPLGGAERRAAVDRRVARTRERGERARHARRRLFEALRRHALVERRDDPHGVGLAES